jgi:hypothetical protein
VGDGALDRCSHGRDLAVPLLVGLGAGHVFLLHVSDLLVVTPSFDVPTSLPFPLGTSRTSVRDE